MTSILPGPEYALRAPTALTEIPVLRPYRQILARPGALAFSVAGFVARLPISMLALAIVLLLTGTGRSYALAGAVAATVSLLNAIAGPRIGRLVDRHGQAPVLRATALVHSAALLGLIAAGTAHAPGPLLFLPAAVAGLTFVSVGGLVRARWSALVGGSKELHTAYAFESVVDEVIFIVGPLAVTALATVVHPAAGVAAVVVLVLGGALALGVQRATEPPRTADPDRGRTAGLRSPGLFVVVGVFGCLGALFGAFEVSVVAFTTAAGARGSAGVVLAAYALGSMIAGLGYGSVHWRTPAATRFRFGALAMGASLLPLPFVDGVGTLTALAFVAGFAISPTLISGNDLVQRLVPGARLTEGLAWTTTGISLGLTVGAATAGRLIDSVGPSRAFWFSTGAALAAAVVAWVGSTTLSQRPHTTH
jgi:hypothetical protein